LKVELDGCDRSDDVDLDVPEHPNLASASELDFDSCMQGGSIYAVATNGGAISGAASATSRREDCLAAVEEEPDDGVGIDVRPGTTMCISNIDETKGFRIFRVRVLQVAGDPTTLALTTTGWRG
jgi:hypothetical protein